MLNLGKWGTNRVSNWMTRGIPPAVKINRPDLFLVEELPEPAPAQQEAA